MHPHHDKGNNNIIANHLNNNVNNYNNNNSYVNNVINHNNNINNILNNNLNNNIINNANNNGENSNRSSTASNSSGYSSSSGHQNQPPSHRFPTNMHRQYNSPVQPSSSSPSLSRRSLVPLPPYLQSPYFIQQHKKQLHQKNSFTNFNNNESDSTLNYQKGFHHPDSVSHHLNSSSHRNNHSPHRTDPSPHRTIPSPRHTNQSLRHSNLTDQQYDVVEAEGVYNWLKSINQPQCFPLFVQSGYDRGTISRMTPEDLTGIGITTPVLRKHLTAHLHKLSSYHPVFSYWPASIIEWLTLLHLRRYESNLMKGSCGTMEKVVLLTWEDLEDIGIKKLGHQKKIMLAIERLKKLRSSDASSLVDPVASQRSMTPCHKLIVDQIEARNKSSPRKNLKTRIQSFSSSASSTPKLDKKLCSDGVERRRSNLDKNEILSSINAYKNNSNALPRSSTLSRKVLNNISIKSNANPSLSSSFSIQRGSPEIVHLSNSIANLPKPEIVTIQVGKCWKNENKETVYESFHGNPTNDFKSLVEPTSKNISPHTDMIYRKSYKNKISDDDDDDDFITFRRKTYGCNRESLLENDVALLSTVHRSLNKTPSINALGDLNDNKAAHNQNEYHPFFTSSTFKQLPNTAPKPNIKNNTHSNYGSHNDPDDNSNENFYDNVSKQGGNIMSSSSTLGRVRRCSEDFSTPLKRQNSHQELLSSECEDQRKNSWKPVPPKRTNSITLHSSPTKTFEQQKINSENHFASQQKQIKDEQTTQIHHYQQAKQKIFVKLASQINNQLPPIGRRLPPAEKRNSILPDHAPKPTFAPVLSPKISFQHPETTHTPSPTNSDSNNFPFANDNAGTIRQNNTDFNKEFISENNVKNNEHEITYNHQKTNSQLSFVAFNEQNKQVYSKSANGKPPILPKPSKKHISVTQLISEGSSQQKNSAASNKTSVSSIDHPFDTTADKHSTSDNDFTSVNNVFDDIDCMFQGLTNELNQLLTN